MEAIRSSETSDYNRFTLHHIPDDCILKIIFSHEQNHEVGNTRERSVETSEKLKILV
jgi:hypothetical protein